jgi:hypothetical protein
VKIRLDVKHSARADSVRVTTCVTKSSSQPLWRGLTNTRSTGYNDCAVNKLSITDLASQYTGAMQAHHAVETVMVDAEIG